MLPYIQPQVVRFSSGLTYMTRGPQTTMLFKPFNFWAGLGGFAFTIHGNPMGTAHQVTGKFAKRTAVTTC
jgi:hypothetical protein